MLEKASEHSVTAPALGTVASSSQGSARLCARPERAASPLAVSLRATQTAPRSPGAPRGPPLSLRGRGVQRALRKEAGAASFNSFPLSLSGTNGALAAESEVTPGARRRCERCSGPGPGSDARSSPAAGQRALEPRARCPRLSLTPDKEAIGKAAAGGAPQLQGDAGALSLPAADEHGRRPGPRPLSPHRRVRPLRPALVERPLPLTPTRSGGQPPAQEPALEEKPRERASGSRAPLLMEGAQRNALPSSLLGPADTAPTTALPGLPGGLGQVPGVFRFWEFLLRPTRPRRRGRAGHQCQLRRGQQVRLHEGRGDERGGRGASVRLWGGFLPRECSSGTPGGLSQMSDCQHGSTAAAGQSGSGRERGSLCAKGTEPGTPLGAAETPRPASLRHGQTWL
ncbi:uncharacterized protein LOC141728959 [Zonotrichia albicollis]|uniref:uncharacterized protein LOC141728959 n=1 Tax=Zonotrichia albicollis TaxID=44394 RepID=UPI003D80B412